MSDITLVTPPDKYYGDETSILLIYPSPITKQQFNDLLSKLSVPIIVYLYELRDDGHEPEWLLDTFNTVDYVILDIDNCPSKIRDLGSYFIAKSKTYWLTNSGDNLYNVLSKNRLYNLDFLTETIGGNFEKQKQL